MMVTHPLKSMNVSRLQGYKLVNTLQCNVEPDISTDRKADNRKTIPMCQKQKVHRFSHPTSL